MVTEYISVGRLGNKQTYLALQPVCLLESFLHHPIGALRDYARNGWKADNRLSPGSMRRGRQAGKFIFRSSAS